MEIEESMHYIPFLEHHNAIGFQIFHIDLFEKMLLVWTEATNLSKDLGV